MEEEILKKQFFKKQILTKVEIGQNRANKRLSRAKLRASSIRGQPKEANSSVTTTRTTKGIAETKKQLPLVQVEVEALH